MNLTAREAPVTTEGQNSSAQDQQPSSIQVLLVEDNAGDAVLLRGMLDAAYPGRYRLTQAQSVRDVSSHPRADFDVILLDLSLPDSQGLGTIAHVSQTIPQTPVVVLTGQTDEQVALDAVRHGAQDYLIKGQIDSRSLARSIGYSIDRKKAQSALQRANDELERKVQDRTAELRQSNRFLEMFSACNQAIVRLRDEKSLLEAVCRIICQIGGYRMAWVGYAQNDPRKSVTVETFVGHEDGYLGQADISYADVPRGHGPTGTCIRECRIVTIEDFRTDPGVALWREAALTRGYHSSISLPLVRDLAAFGALNIYSDRPRAFHYEQVAILKELVDNLAFGIVAIRTNSALRESQEQLQAVLHNAPVLIWASDLGGVCLLADGRLDTIGLTQQQMVGKDMTAIFGRRADIASHIRQAAEGQQVAAELEICGTTFESRYSPMRDEDGGITGVLCVWTDITERRRVERELMKAAEREQRRIGQDIHDSIQGNLGAISFMLGSLTHSPNQEFRTDTLQPQLERIGQIVRDTISQARNLAKSLCPVELGGEGLRIAMEHLAVTTGELFRLACTFECDESLLIDNQTVATQFYYIAQEAVNNAVKHAQASHIRLSMHRQEGQVKLTVADDGIGIGADAASSSGMGLRTMRHRAAMIGARLDIRRGEGGGTLVQCSAQA